jgi:hypothetical protein
VGVRTLQALGYCFGLNFGLILYGKTPFSYVFTVSCAGLAFGTLLLPPEEAPA